MTATRGCRADGAVWPLSLLGGAWDVEVGNGGTAAEAGEEATSLVCSLERELGSGLR